MSSSQEPKQLGLLFDQHQADALGMSSSSHSPTAARRGGRRSRSGSSSVGSKLTVADIALLCGISGFSSSPKEADPTTTCCSGFRRDSVSPGQTVRHGALGQPTVSGRTE